MSIILVLVSLFLYGSCKSPETHQKKTLSVEHLLFGGKGCKTDEDCESNNCSMGICLGLLMTAVEVKREKVVERLRIAIEDDEVRRDAFLALTSILSDEGNDVFLKCRALHGLSVFPKEMVLPILRKFTESAEPSLKFYSLRSLAFMCEQSGFEGLKTFVSHPSPAVRQLAETAFTEAKARCASP